MYYNLSRKQRCYTVFVVLNLQSTVYHQTDLYKFYNDTEYQMARMILYILTTHCRLSIPRQLQQTNIVIILNPGKSITMQT